MQKKFIKKTIIFVSFNVFLLFIFSFFDNIDKDNNNNFNILSLQNKSRFDSLDILFIGNSYCYSGIVPSYFDSIGVKTYNLGIATSGPYFYELITNDYLEFTKEKPKSIFILVSPISFSSKADNFFAYHIHRYLQQPTSNIEIFYKYEKSIFDMYKKSIRKASGNLLKFFFTYEEIHYNISLKGYFPYNNNKVSNQKIIQETEDFYLPLKKETFNIHYFEYLKKYAEELSSKNITVVFYELPTNLLNNYFNDKYLYDYNISLKELKNKYIYLSNDLELKNTYFRNIDHMNKYGAEVTTLRMIEKLKDIKDLMYLFKNNN